MGFPPLRTTDGTTTVPATREMEFAAADFLVTKLGAKATITSLVPSANVEAFSVADTLDSANDVAICDASGGDFILTLPPVLGLDGKRYTIHSESTGKVTIDGDGTETVHGKLTVELTSALSYIEIVCDETNSNWIVASQYHSDFKRVELTADTVTATSNVVVDVSGSSIVLTNGDWAAGYDVLIGLNDDAGSPNNVAGKVHMTTAANTDIDGTAALIRLSVMQTDQTFEVQASRRVEIKVTADVTHKLRLECNETITTDGFARIRGLASFLGNITEPDNESSIWARKISV